MEEDYIRQIKNNFQEFRHKVKFETNTGILWEINNRSALDDTPEERQANYERFWKIGGPSFAWGCYNDLTTNPESNATASIPKTENS
ncbi:hypothetical protein [Peribacillus frigoritolerans]|uniref:hypothetical protein n=1 Tax=Peribacillus frigoritolerans TaxID=450367 RepID=UPI003F7ED368